MLTWRGRNQSLLPPCAGPLHCRRDACEEVINWLLEKSGETDPVIIGGWDGGPWLLGAAEVLHLRTIPARPAAAAICIEPLSEPEPCRCFGAD
jgi:hypothetical protein